MRGTLYKKKKGQRNQYMNSCKQSQFDTAVGSKIRPRTKLINARRHKLLRPTTKYGNHEHTLACYVSYTDMCGRLDSVSSVWCDFRCSTRSPSHPTIDVPTAATATTALNDRGGNCHSSLFTSSSMGAATLCSVEVYPRMLRKMSSTCCGS